jgi:hypothetical protein
MAGYGGYADADAPGVSKFHFQTSNRKINEMLHSGHFRGASFVLRGSGCFPWPGSLGT